MWQAGWLLLIATGCAGVALSATAGGCYQVCREGTNDTIGLRGVSGHGLWILGRTYKRGCVRLNSEDSRKVVWKCDRMV